MTEFNRRERKGVELQAHILFKLQEARRWTNGCASQVNGQFVPDVTNVQHILDKVIDGLTKLVDRSKADDRDGKEKGSKLP